MVDLFRTIDRSGDNVCDLDEMCTMMKSVGLNLSREAVKVTAVGESRAQVYNRPQSIYLHSPNLPPKAMIDYIDKDGNGLLDAKVRRLRSWVSDVFFIAASRVLMFAPLV